MNVRYRLVAALLAATATTAIAQRLSPSLGEVGGLRLTESCPAEESPAYASIAATPAFRAEMVATANNPNLDPALAYALWMPVTGRETAYQNVENRVILDYDRFQDVREIARVLKADASLAARGLVGASAAGYACFSPPPAPGFVRVAEYYQSQSNHYQLAVGEAESAALAADGWSPTGESFHALTSGYCYGATNVFRFERSFATRRGSRFLTIDAHECGQVRKGNRAWRARDIPFYAAAAQGGMCSFRPSTVAVYRLYNGREMFNDMNHRFTTSSATYAQMLAQGWIGEGVAFCTAE
jgi:hypothetical protein